jgi:hypothetical protein
MAYYVCHVAVEDEPLLLFWMPPRPSTDEVERRRRLLSRARNGKARDLKTLAIDYRVTLPLVMPTLSQSLQQTVLSLAHRPPQNGACHG